MDSGLRARMSTAMFAWLMLWIGGLAAAPAFAQVTVSVKTEGDHHRIVAETPLFRATIVPEWGGRIVSLFDKQIDREVVYFQDGQGGLLDERDEFTATHFIYTAVVDRKRVSTDGAAQSALLIELDGTAYGGFNVRKRLWFYPDKLFIRVHYRLANYSQHDRAIWVRNFIRLGENLSDAARWVLPTAEGVKTLTAKDVHAVSEMPQPWAALLDTERKAGVLGTAESGLFQHLYFWLDSSQFSTFEWVSQTVPAGQSVEAMCYLVLLHEIQAVDEKAMMRLAPDGNGQVRHEPKFTGIGGWRDLRPKFTLSERDSVNGFVLYAIRDSQAKPLTDLTFDVPPGGADSQWAMLSALRDVTVDLSLSGALGERVGVWREEGEQRRLRRVQRLELKQGDIVSLLLDLDGAALKAGEYRGELRVASGQDGQTVTLKAKVWDILVPDRPLLYWRGYGASSYLHTRGYKLEQPDALDRLRKFFSDGKAIGQSVHEWGFLGNRLIPQVRLRETGELVADAAKKGPLLGDGRLPALDFSFLDPVADIALEFGLRYADMVAPDPKHWATTPIYRLAWGKDVASDSDQAKQVYQWFVGEFVRYVRERGYPVVFGKVMDEISSEHLPAYLRYAQQAKAAGLRIFTTITGTPSGVERLVDAMASVNEGWQVQLMSNLTFERLRSKVRPSDVVTYYGGGSKPYRWDYAQGRRYGWFAAARGYAGYAFWAYVHWQPTENIVFEEADGRLTRTPVWYGLRDGNADGNLLRLLQRLIARAEKAATTPEQQRALAQVQATARQVCGSDPNTVLPLVERNSSASRYLWFPDDVTDQQFVQARRLVLEALTQLQHSFPPQSFAPDLWWGDLQIAARGQSNFQVIAENQTAKQRLTEIWRDGLQRVTMFATNNHAAAPSTQVVVFAQRPGDEELRELNLDRAALGITERFPAADYYVIASGGNVITVIGEDESGAKRGLRALLAAMELRW